MSPDISFTRSCVINPAITVFLRHEQAWYTRTIERVVLETANTWFVKVVNDSISKVIAVLSTRHS